jgi:hypothetical protein
MSIAIVVTMVASALAHHSFAVFDHTRTLTLRGTVTKFQWTNPHGFIEMDVKQDDGSVKHFAIELTSINMMQRVGWRSNMIKAGDTVQVVMAPLLSGEPVGLGLEVVLADGKTMNMPVPNIVSFKRTAQERGDGCTQEQNAVGRGVRPAVRGLARHRRSITSAAGYNRLVAASGVHSGTTDGAAEPGRSTRRTTTSCTAPGQGAISDRVAGTAQDDPRRRCEGRAAGQ